VSYQENYKNWLNNETLDSDLKKELLALKDEKDIEECFYQDLKFGTAGMRGILGVGINRMNIYTVAKATLGLARFLIKNDQQDQGVAIAYDSRIKSDVFAKVAARVLAANGVKVYLFDSLRPVPVLSFTVRYLKAAAGIVITASHNPKEYNGYKVYGPDGGQMASTLADALVKEIEAIDSCFGIALADKEDPQIQIIPSEVDDAYAKAVEKIVKPHTGEPIKIIYTPLHGSGNIPVRRILKDLGYHNVSVIKEQELPDGHFPTVIYPNPEEKSVFTLAIQMAEKNGADIIFGTDPDSDRLGVVCRNSDGEYVVFTGNQTGALMVDYLLKTRKWPDNKTIVKTIVTSELGAAIAKSYGADVVDVLTGFKYIGEQMTNYKKTGDRTFVVGYEESYGYLSGDYARDKDAVFAAALVSEMAGYYKQKGMTLYDALETLYDKFGYYNEGIQAIKFEGITGKSQIDAIMDKFRTHYFDHFADEHLIRFNDYQSSESIEAVHQQKTKIQLPQSNVLKFMFDQNSWYALRPSGTEPKLKIYYSVVGKNRDEAGKKMKILKDAVNAII